MQRTAISAALAAAFAGFLATPAFADEASDLVAIRKQLNAIQHE